MSHESAVATLAPPASRGAALTSRAPALELRAVSRRWEAGVPGCSVVVHALRGVSLHVRAGEVVAVVGDAGAGKSTLLQCAAGRLRPDAGAVRWCGRAAPPPCLDVVLHSASDAGAPALGDRRRVGERTPSRASPCTLVLADDLAWWGAARELARLRETAEAGAAVLVALRDLALARRWATRTVRLAHGRVVELEGGAA